jgi:repressor LexA
MPETLTAIERRIYHYLVDYLKRETYQPSIREIGVRFGIRSTKTVTEHLQSLQRKGYLDRTPSRSRALRILGLNLSPDTYTIPLYRNAERELSDEEVEARYDLDRSLACSPDSFLVRVSSDSMGEWAILEGDLILVEPCGELRDTDLVVCERDGRVEVRRRGRALGSGDGSAARSSAVEGNGGPSFRILGVARAVLRRLPRD